jgi:non-ribosomal peptide synthetase component F
MFALQNAPLPAPRTPGLTLIPIELPSRSSKFDLTLFATEVAEGLRLTLEFRSDLFDAATADRMLARYGILLEEIIAHPDRPIGGLSMLTPEERDQLLMGWNTEATDDFSLPFDEPDDDDIPSFFPESPSMEVAAHE